MTTATVSTIQALIAFIYEEGSVSVDKVCTEFNIGKTDAEELLSTLDTSDGTLYQFDEDTYTIEDSERELEDVLHTHTMGGGIALNQPLPVKQSKSAKAQKEDNVTATTAKPKAKDKKTKKAKGKTKATKTPKVETPKVETPKVETPKAKRKAKKKAAKAETTTAIAVVDKKAAKAKSKKDIAAEKKAKAAEAKAEKKAKADALKAERAEARSKAKAEKAQAKAEAKAKKAKEKKPRVVEPRSSRTIEDKAEAKTLGVKVGTEVKECFDCKVTFAKYGGQFRPRWTEAERKLNEGIKATNGGEINPKHVQPRCIACDRLRSKRKTRLKALTRAVAVEIGSDTVDAEAVVQRLNRKTAGIPDGKSSTVLIDDSIEEFTPSLRGVLVSLAEGLIKIRWTSGETPEILGATKKAIAGVKPPKVKAPEPKPKAKPKLTVIKGDKAKKPTKAKAETKPKVKRKVRQPKVKKDKVEAKAEGTAEQNPW